MRTESNLMGHELIGLQIHVLKSSHPGWQGIKGRVVDETKNTLAIQTRSGEKKIPKQGAWFRFQVGEKKVDVEGSLLVSRPEDRLKKFWRKKYGKLWRHKLPFSRQTQD